MNALKKLLLLFITAASAGAVVQELSKPKEQRTWHGSVLGVPYDFRLPSVERIRAAYWNPEDERLFTPLAFGVGWGINIPRLLQKLRETSEMASDDGV